MVVYGEVLFAENAVIGAVLLYITGQICRGCNAGKYRKLRLLAGSVMCGGFSLVIFLNMKAYLLLPLEAVFAVTVCMVVFGRGRRPWKPAITFILVTYFMGGVTMGLLLLAGQPGIYTAAGIYTGDMKAAALAVFVCMGYITSMQIIKTVRSSRFYTEHSCRAVIVCGSEKLTVNAFLDTGNHLTEPVTGKPVALASEKLWHRMQGCGSVPENEYGNIPYDDEDDEVIRRFALIPYEAVGIRGVLEAVRVDRMEISGKKIKGCYIAKSDGKFQMNGRRHKGEKEAEWELLLSAEMADTLL